jgi:nucleotide-binding universal stress UspA family protein
MTMKILVGYNGSGPSKRALELAGRCARTATAAVHVVTSMEGGSGERPEDIYKVKKGLEEARNFLEGEGIEYEISELARGLSPGEDLVSYAEENRIDHIFIGIEKRSRVGKLLLGSTAQYIILNAPCPVTTVKP